MNWMLIAVGVIFLVSIIMGIWRGAIKITVSLMTTFLVMALVFFVTPYVTGAVYSFTPIPGMVEDQILESTTNMATALLSGETANGQMNEESVRNALNAAGVSEEDLNAMGISIQDIVEGKVTSEDLRQHGISANVLNGAQASNQQPVNVVDLSSLSRDEQIAAINNADIPEVFKSLLLTNNNDAIYQRLGADGFVSYIAKYLTKLIINVVAFLFTFIIVTIVVRAIVLALDIISNLPGLGFLNRFAGGVLGMIGAAIIVWVCFVVVTLLYSTNIGKELFMMIQEEPLLTMLYEYNPIMKLATTFR